MIGLSVLAVDDAPPLGASGFDGAAKFFARSNRVLREALYFNGREIRLEFAHAPREAMGDAAGKRRGILAKDGREILVRVALMQEHRLGGAIDRSLLAGRELTHSGMSAIP